MEYCVLVYDVRFGIKNKKAWICLKGTGMVKKRIELHHPSLLFIMCVKRVISCSKQVVSGEGYPGLDFIRILKIPSIFLGFWV